MDYRPDEFDVTTTTDRSYITFLDNELGREHAYDFIKQLSLSDANYHCYNKGGLIFVEYESSIRY